MVNDALFMDMVKAQESLIRLLFASEINLCPRCVYRALWGAPSSSGKTFLSLRPVRSRADLLIDLLLKGVVVLTVPRGLSLTRNALIHGYGASAFVPLPQAL